MHETNVVFEMLERRFYKQWVVDLEYNLIDS
jgi:hypothetical protein